MKIEDVRSLIKKSDDGVLRIPSSLRGEDFNTTYGIHKVFKTIIDDIIRNPFKYPFIASVEGKRVLHESGLNKVEKIFNNYIDVHTDFGSGVVRDAHTLFNGDVYPTYITPGYCYSNAFLYVICKEVDAKVLSGIAFVGKPFLHSVVLQNGMVIDFNYDLVMSKELYFKLTHFEILETLDSKQILENKETLLENRRFLKNFNYAEINFAFEDVISRIQNRLNTTKVEI